MSDRTDRKRRVVGKDVRRRLGCLLELIEGIIVGEGTRSV